MIKTTWDFIYPTRWYSLEGVGALQVIGDSLILGPIRMLNRIAQ
jgi:hypothetical protein